MNDDERDKPLTDGNSDRTPPEPPTTDKPEETIASTEPEETATVPELPAMKSVTLPATEPGLPFEKPPAVIPTQPDDLEPEPESKPKTGEKVLLLGSALLLAAAIAVGVYMFAFRATPETAFSDMITNLAEEQYSEVTQEFDAGFFSGTLVATVDMSDVSNPEAKGTFDYTLALFSNAALSEEFVSVKDSLSGKLISAEVNGEAVPEDELSVPLNKWVGVKVDGEVLNTDFSTTELAGSLNTALGLLPTGNFQGEARQLVIDELTTALSYDERSVKETTVNDRDVYKYDVTFDVDKIQALNKRLNEEFDVYVEDPTSISDDSAYVEEAEFYIDKRTNHLLRVITSYEEDGQTTEIIITSTPLDSAPDIELPEAEFVPETT